MTRLHYVKRARKHYRKAGINKGQAYWWYKFAYGPVVRCARRPRPSQLTRSEFLGAVYAAQEAVEDAHTESSAGDVDDQTDFDGFKQPVIDALNEARDTVEEQRDLCNERAHNMEERFPNGCPTMELLQERAEACETLLDEIDAAVSAVEGAETADEVEQAVNQVEWSVD